MALPCSLITNFWSFVLSDCELLIICVLWLQTFDNLCSLIANFFIICVLIIHTYHEKKALKSYWQKVMEIYRFVYWTNYLWLMYILFRSYWKKVMEIYRFVYWTNYLWFNLYISYSNHIEKKLWKSTDLCIEQITSDLIYIYLIQIILKKSYGNLQICALNKLSLI